jgi:protease I
MNSPLRIAVLLDHLANELGALYPTYRLAEEGYCVEVLTPDGGPALRGHSGMALDRFITVKGPISQANPNEYDGAMCPGGFSADKLRGNSHVQAFLRRLDVQGKPIAHFGHGAWITLSAGVLKGRRAVAPSQIRSDLENAGVAWCDEPAVVDGHIVSGRDWGALCKAFIACLRR